MQIDVTDGSFEAFVARPALSSAPVVVVLQEIFGINADLRATCQELADKGFIAIAPALFWREAPGHEFNAWSKDEWRRALALYRAFDFDRGVRDIDATLEVARKLGNGKVGVMGFCLGGLMVFLTSARTKVDAGVAYYGGETDKYLGEAERISSPLLMHLAEEDEFMPKDAQARIKQSLGTKPNVELFSYPGCFHAFARHTGTHYDPTAAKLANARTADFLRRTLSA